MPAEFAPQQRCWMAWPSGGYVLGDNEREAEEARIAWAAVANTIAEYEELVMVVDPEAEESCRPYLSASVTRVIEPLNDAWMRDFGPTFVTGERGELGAVVWTFNGWGAQDWARWDLDSKIGAAVADRAGALLVSSEMVNEGGAIHVDGAGTVLATLSVQLDPGRNPNLNAADVEREFARTLGATHTVWLPRGLYRDAKPPATRGHIDMMACFTEGGHVLVHEQLDTGHPDREIMTTNTRILSEATDAHGKPLDLVRIPAPRTLIDETGDFVDYNYVNHLVINGAVLVPSFGDPEDERAAALLQELYPGREIRAIESRAIFRQGGGIHCITQQQPASAAHL
jgi:agmatine deiminase